MNKKMQKRVAVRFMFGFARSASSAAGSIQPPQCLCSTSAQKSLEGQDQEGKFMGGSDSAASQAGADVIICILGMHGSLQP